MDRSVPQRSENRSPQIYKGSPTGPCIAGDPVRMLLPRDEIPGLVSVPADRSVSGWMNQPLQLIDYLREENRALREPLS